MKLQEKIFAQKEWKFDFKRPLVGLFQSDRTDHVTAFDDLGGVFVLAPTGELLLDILFSGGVISARVVKLGTLLVVLDCTGCIHGISLIRENRGKVLWKKFVIVDPMCMDAESTGRGFCVGSQSGLVTFLNFKGEKQKALYVDHAVHFAKYAHDVPYLVCAAETGQVSLFDPNEKYEWSFDMQTACTGVDVDADASVILLPTLQDGIHAYTKNREAIGVYEVGGDIDRAVLSQKGNRLLVSNRQGRLHVIDRQGQLLSFFDMGKRIARMDMNYDGTRMILQQEAQEISIFTLHCGDEKSVQFLTLADRKDEIPEKWCPSPPCWKVDVVGLSKGRAILTANGQFCVLLTDIQRLMCLGNDGQILWEEALDPRFNFEMQVSRMGNLIVLWCEEFVDLLTCQQGRIKRFQTKVGHLSVHEGGLHFALATGEGKVGFFDKNGVCLWAHQFVEAVVDIKINSMGNAVFVLFESGALKVYDSKGALSWDASSLPNQSPIRCFSLDRFGVTAANQENVLLRMTPDGKTPWQFPLEADVQRLHMLKETIVVHSCAGNALFVSRQGDLIGKTTQHDASDLRHFYIDVAGTLCVLMGHEKVLQCQDVKEGTLLWEMKMPNEIYQLDSDPTGVKMAYVAQGEVGCLPLVPPETQVSERVTFLEF